MALALLLTFLAAASDERVEDARPSGEAVVEFFASDLGLSCERSEKGPAVHCDRSFYPDPSAHAGISLDGHSVRAMAVGVGPTEGKPMAKGAELMLKSLELPFPDARPADARAWLLGCLGARTLGERPSRLDLGSAFYECIGQPEAPQYMLVFRKAQP